MKILVTGGIGFIGHNVVRLLEEQGHEVLIVDNLSDYGIIPKEELTYLVKERSKLVKSIVNQVDIADFHYMNSIFSFYKPDVVIHLASFPRQKVVNKNPVTGSKVMSEGLINLCELSQKYNVKKFVYVSSSMVYGDFNDNKKEDGICNPIGIYGILKLAGENIVKDYSRRNIFDHVIVRPSAVYGPLDVEDRVMSKFILSAMRNQTLKVNGIHEFLDFTFVNDTAVGIVKASLSENAKNKTYNITRGKSYSLYYAAQLVLEVVKKGTIEILEKDINFPSRASLNIDLARNDLDYNPTVDLEEGIIKYYEYLKSSPYFSSK